MSAGRLLFSWFCCSSFSGSLAAAQGTAPPDCILQFAHDDLLMAHPITSSRPYGTFRPANFYPGLRPGLSSARPVQISFERCLGSATALSLQRPSPCCHPERSERTCGAPFVCPAPTGPQPPPILTESSWKNQPSLCHSGFPGVVRGTADSRSAALGMTTKERVVPRRGRLLNRGIFQN
jgi:hypothetical protein